MATRRQVYSSSYSRRRTVLIVVAVIALLILIGVLVFKFAPIYRPPGVDPGVSVGEPYVEEGYLYKKIDSDFGYSFFMAVNLYRQEDGSVNIYLTNPSDSSVSLMCEIRDMKSDELYYKSGRIRPGEYVANLSPVTDFDNIHHDVDVKIYALDKATYLSEGTTELKLSLQPW